MHLNEGRQTKQLEMQLGVVQNAINKLIGMISQNTIEIQKLQKRVDMISRNQGSVSSSDTKTENHDENYELDISQVQKILKQQSSNPSKIGKRVINN